MLSKRNEIFFFRGVKSFWFPFLPLWLLFHVAVFFSTGNYTLFYFQTVEGKNMKDTAFSKRSKWDAHFESSVSRN